MGFFDRIRRAFDSKCPHCGKPVGFFEAFTTEACPYCGGRFTSMQCPVCHSTEYLAKDRETGVLRTHCRRCSAKFPDPGPVREMVKYLRRGDGVLAYRECSLEAFDFHPPIPVGAMSDQTRVKGEVVVESGSLAAVFVDGRLVRIADPGRHDLAGLTGNTVVRGRLSVMVFDGGVFSVPAPNILRLKTEGLPEGVAEVMLPEAQHVAEGPGQLTASRAFSFEGLLDREGLPISLNVTLWMQLRDPERFFHNVFKAAFPDPQVRDPKGADARDLLQFTYEDAAALLYPIVLQFLSDQVRQFPYEDLRTAGRRTRVEAELVERVNLMVEPDGVRAVRAAVMNVANAAYDELQAEAGQLHVEKIRRNRALQALRDETEILAARIEARKQILAQVTAGELALEAAEKRLATDQAVLLARLASEGRLRLNQVDLDEQNARERALLDLYRAQLAREDEVRPLLEAREDHALARQQFLALLALQNEHEQKLLAVAQQGALEMAQGKNEIQKIEQNIQAQRALLGVLQVQSEQKLLAARTEAQVEEIRTDSEVGQVRKWQELKQQKQTFDLDLEMKRTNQLLDARMREIEQHRRFELDKIALLENLDLKKIEALKGDSQAVVAYLSQKNPALANALVAMTTNAGTNAARDEYVRQLQAQSQQTQQLFMYLMQMVGGLAGQAFESAAQMAQGGRPEVLVTGSGQQPFVHAPGYGLPIQPVPAQTIPCPKCHKAVAVGSPKCGHCDAEIVAGAN